MTETVVHGYSPDAQKADCSIVVLVVIPPLSPQIHPPLLILLGQESVHPRPGSTSWLCLPSADPLDVFLEPPIL